MPKRSWKVRRTASPSPFRRSPLSTKTHWSWSPIARCTSAAVTAESTPPESAHSTRSRPTVARTDVDRLVDEGAHRPARLEPGELEEEVLEDALPLGRVGDLGVELHGVEAPLRRGHRGDRAVPRGGQRPEARRRREDGVAVAHPHRDAPGGRVRATPSKSRSGVLQGDLGAAVLPVGARLDLPAQEQGHGLHAVADAEDGNARLEQRGRRQRRPLVVDAVRASGEDDGLVREDALERDGRREDLGVDARLRGSGGRSAA